MFYKCQVFSGKNCCDAKNTVRLEKDQKIVSGINYFTCGNDGKSVYYSNVKISGQKLTI